MKITEFKMTEGGLISVTVVPTVGKTSFEVDFPMTPELEQCIATQVTVAIKSLLSEKSDLTAAVAKV